MATLNCTTNSIGAYNFTGQYRHVATVENTTGYTIRINSYSMYLGMLGSVHVGGDGVGDEVTGLGKAWNTTVRIGDSNVSQSTTISSIVTQTGTVSAGGVYPYRSQTSLCTFTFSTPYVLSSGESVNIYILTPGGTGTTNVLVLKYEDPTPYVDYSPYTFTVSYDANGGTGAPSSQTKTGGQALTLSTTKPTRSAVTTNFTITGDGNGGKSKSITAKKQVSYTFQGWSTSKTGSAEYQPGGSFNVDKDTTLYAVWGSTTTYSNNSIADLGTTTRSGSYLFVGWGSSKTSTSVLASSKTFTSDTTVYAIWQLLTAEVTINGNGGEVSYTGSQSLFDSDYGQIISGTVDIGAVLNLSDLYCSWDETSGKTLKSWNTKSDGSGTSYSLSGSLTVSGDTTVYAISNLPDNVTVTWMDGHTSTPIQTKSYAYGSSVPKSDYPPDPVWEGHKFNGWFGSTNNLYSDTKVTAMWGTSPVWIMTESGWAKYTPKEAS